MSIESLMGILLMIVAVAGMGADFCFQPETEDRIINPAKCVSVFLFYLGTLLLAPAAFALYLPIFHYSGVTMAIYGVAMVIIGTVATMFAKRLWFEFFMLYAKFMKRSSSTLRSP